MARFIVYFRRERNTATPEALQGNPRRAKEACQESRSTPEADREIKRAQTMRLISSVSEKTGRQALDACGNLRYIPGCRRICTPGYCCCRNSTGPEHRVTTRLTL